MTQFFYKTSVFILLFFVSKVLLASQINFSQIFAGKSACFILFDLNQNKLIEKYNPDRCRERIPPDSTFKVALSVMAFDQKLINQQTVFKWDGKDKGLFKVWNQNQTPKSWIKNSTVWVSQVLTPQLGMEKIQQYLKKFHYGNQDFSGDPHKDNGITQAWMSSSLRLSGEEQFNFIEALVNEKLSVSLSAMKDTKENMYIETSLRGWKLYGKSGSGAQQRYNPHAKSGARDGWFVGFIEKGQQTYVFVLNFSDLDTPNSTEFGGLWAKGVTKSLLMQEGLF